MDHESRAPFTRVTSVIIHRNDLIKYRYIVPSIGRFEQVVTTRVLIEGGRSCSRKLNGDKILAERLENQSCALATSGEEKPTGPDIESRLHPFSSHNGERSTRQQMYLIHIHIAPLRDSALLLLLLLSGPRSQFVVIARKRTYEPGDGRFRSCP